MNYAKEKGFDPLIPVNWYSVNPDALREYKVRKGEGRGDGERGGKRREERGEERRGEEREEETERRQRRNGQTEEKTNHPFLSCRDPARC